MAADVGRDREAEERSEGLIGDSCHPPDLEQWFKALDRLNSEPFMADGQNQPTAPTAEPSNGGLLSKEPEIGH